jgi:hypothetical protein
MVSKKNPLDHFSVHVPDEVKYSQLDLELVSLEDNRSRTPKKPSMAEENKNDEA